MPDPNTSTLTV